MDRKKTELMEYLDVAWRKKWLILLPTLFCILVAGIYSLLSPPVWEVDCLIQPAKFYLQTASGGLQEFFAADPRQLVGQINQGAYHQAIAEELGLKPRQLFDLKAEIIKDTNLVRASIPSKDIPRAKSILDSLLRQLKKQVDSKVDVEARAIDTQIAAGETRIRQREVLLKDKQSEIKLIEIDKSRIRQVIQTSQNKLKISEERVASLKQEMKVVLARTQELEKEQQNVLAAKQEAGSAVSLLLYSNEIQQNLRYLNNLETQLNEEKVGQENLSLLIAQKKEELKEKDTQAVLVVNQMEKINNEMESIKDEIALFKVQKGRIDYLLFSKIPTPSFDPIAPRLLLNVLIAAALSLAVFFALAFLMDAIERKDVQR
jgi:hypothetical protein